MGGFKMKIGSRPTLIRRNNPLIWVAVLGIGCIIGGFLLYKCLTSPRYVKQSFVQLLDSIPSKGVYLGTYFSGYLRKTDKIERPQISTLDFAVFVFRKDKLNVPTIRMIPNYVLQDDSSYAMKSDYSPTDSLLTNINIVAIQGRAFLAIEMFAVRLAHPLNNADRWRKELFLLELDGAKVYRFFLHEGDVAPAPAFLPNDYRYWISGDTLSTLSSSVSFPNLLLQKNYLLEGEHFKIVGTDTVLTQPFFKGYHYQSVFEASQKVTNATPEGRLVWHCLKSLHFPKGFTIASQKPDLEEAIDVFDTTFWHPLITMNMDLIDLLFFAEGVQAVQFAPDTVPVRGYFDPLRIGFGVPMTSHWPGGESLHPITSEVAALHMICALAQDDYFFASSREMYFLADSAYVQQSWRHATEVINHPQVIAAAWRHLRQWRASNRDKTLRQIQAERRNPMEGSGIVWLGQPGCVLDPDYPTEMKARLARKRFQLFSESEH
jgi:hypothetical protein